MPTVRKAHKRSRSKQFADLRAIVTRTGKKITRTETIDGRKVRFEIKPPAGGPHAGRAFVVETDLGAVGVSSSKKKSRKKKK